MIQTLSRTGIMSPKEILLLCARTRMVPYQSNRICAGICVDQDFDDLLAAAAGHGLVPLLCYHLEATSSSALPPAWRSRLREEFQNNVKRNLFLTSGLFRVLAALESRGVEAVPHKGPALAAQAYGDIALRQFADLDLIVRQSDIPAAHETLRALGYRSEIPWAAGPEPARIPGQYMYYDRQERISLELHSESTLRYLPHPINLEELFLRLEQVEVGGRYIATFAAEDALPMLCVHGAKHLWDRLSWVTDVSELVQIPRGFDWQRAMDQAARLGAMRMVLLGLRIARELIGTPLPEEILSKIASDRAVPQLALRVVKQFYAGAGSCPGPIQRFGMRIQMRGDALCGLGYAFRLATKPTEQDWEAVRLPRVLTPLYALVHPFRRLRTRKGDSTDTETK
jgi:Uncharacterised nucleotidyltransferase